ncbi:MAG: S41 family peptidase [Planctomycetes bacterium]|nr:S41 family peptidase [Planctomycetota bacterium]
MHKHGLTGVAIFGLIGLLFLRLPPMVAQQDSMFNTYRALVEVDALAKQQFVERFDDDRLVDGAIRGMMRQLDPYSGYIAPNELAGFRRRHAGEYIGLGIAMGMRAGRLAVIASVDGSPAAKAGILAGDLILAINHHETKEMSVVDANEHLSGGPGAPVILRVQHAGEDEPVDVTIGPGRVILQTVRGFRRAPDGGWDYALDPQHAIAYVRVSAFHRNTTRSFDRALRRAFGQGARDIILDLRFNPGGLLEAGVAMVDRFVSAGLIVATVTRRQAMHQYHANSEGTLVDPKLVVLINAGSASSAEIVAGALQDHGRALLVGERSFGKGSVQHLINLTTHDAAIKLTVAYYRLPSGRIIHRLPRHKDSDPWGVQPDVKVELTAEETAAIQASRRALDEAHRTAKPVATEGADEGTGKRTDEEKNSVRGSSTPLEIVRDRQLVTALSILREQRLGSP